MCATSQEVFWWLHQRGLKLQPKKCHLFQHEVTYLGHVISEKGVAMDPAKTAAVRDWRVGVEPNPKNGIRKSTVGFYEYYLFT